MDTDSWLVSQFLRWAEAWRIYYDLHYFVTGQPPVYNSENSQNLHVKHDSYLTLKSLFIVVNARLWTSVVCAQRVSEATSSWGPQSAYLAFVLHKPHCLSIPCTSLNLVCHKGKTSCDCIFIKHLYWKCVTRSRSMLLTQRNVIQIIKKYVIKHNHVTDIWP